MNDYLATLISALGLFFMFVFASALENSATTRERDMYQGLMCITIAVFMWPPTYGHFKWSCATWLFCGIGVLLIIISLLRRSKPIQQHDD